MNLILKLWTQCHHNYKLRKHTLNTQITCCNEASDSMENQNLETKKNLYVRQRFQLLSLKNDTEYPKCLFSVNPRRAWPRVLSPDNKDLSFLGICQKCSHYTSVGAKGEARQRQNEKF